MTRTILVLALLSATLLASPARAGEQLHADDPWARAIGETRSLENDLIGCPTQRNVDVMNGARRNPGIAIEIAGCTLFLRGDRVVITNLEYGPGLVYGRIHLVDDLQRYWVAAPVELFEYRGPPIPAR